MWNIQKEKKKISSVPTTQLPATRPPIYTQLTYMLVNIQPKNFGITTIVSRKLVISSHSNKAGVHFLNSSPLPLSYSKIMQFHSDPVLTADIFSQWRRKLYMRKMKCQINL